MNPVIPSPYFSSTMEAPAYSVSSTGGQHESDKESRTLSGMLLAAVLAALLVAADQVIDTWVDGHMLAAWVALWTVAFAALALLAPPLRKLTWAVALGVARYRQVRKERRIEAQMWEYARHDPRIMVELQQAWLRSEPQD